MVTLIESTVRVTIRHSDSPPIASEAATALVNRDEVTGGGWLTKPAAPGDRIMAEILQDGGGESLPSPRESPRNRWQYWGGSESKVAK